MVVLTEDMMKVVSEVEKAAEQHMHALRNVSYETGLLGYVVVYGMLYKYSGDDKYYGKAESYFMQAVNLLDPAKYKRVFSTDSFDAHLAHLGRFIIYNDEHKLINVDAQGYLSELDAVLGKLMQTKLTICDLDISSGALAAGYYFLARAKNGEESASKFLAILVGGIEKCVNQTPEGGVYWKSPSLYNRIYLGLSHGSGLVMSFLASVHELGIEEKRVSSLLKNAFTFLLSQGQSNNFKGIYPTQMGEAVGNRQFSLGYGDLGIGLAVLKAGLTVNDKQMIIHANHVLEDCLSRKWEDNLTLDAGIFYGAAGLSIGFEAVYQLNHDDRYRRQSVYWVDKIKKYKKDEGDFAGFTSRLSVDNPLWNVSFGYGILGVAATLLEHAKEDMPSLIPLTLAA